MLQGTRPGVTSGPARADTGSSHTPRALKVFRGKRENPQQVDCSACSEVEVPVRSPGCFEVRARILQRSQLQLPCRVGPDRAPRGATSRYRKKGKPERLAGWVDRLWPGVLAHQGGTTRSLVLVAMGSGIRVHPAVSCSTAAR